MTIGGVFYCGGEHVGEPQRPIIAQQQHPGLERARYARGEQPSPRHHVESKPTIVGNRRRGGGYSLPADHFGPTTAHVEDKHRNVAAGTVQVRLDDLQGKRGRDCGIKGIAAFFKGPHAHRGRDPVG